MHGGNNTGSGSGKKHELLSRVIQPIHNHTREPHTMRTTINMDMDNETESIDNQSEEVAVAASAATTSIMTGLIEQEADDEDCAGTHGEEEEQEEMDEEEAKARQRRRSYPRPHYMESTWGQWLRKLENLQKRSVAPVAENGRLLRGAFGSAFVGASAAGMRVSD